MQADTPDDVLVQGILRGDRRAFRLLIERYQNLVFTIALRITASREDAEEVAQDVFIKAYNGLSSWQGKAKLSSWLYRIAYNTALTKIRNQGPGLSSLDDEKAGNAMIAKAASVYNDAEQVFTAEYVAKAIHMLDAEDAAIITLFYLSEQTLDEIAQVLDIAPNAAKVRLHRARQKLRDKMAAPALKSPKGT
jgi:RNA polymerase sigma factor (sigma-70 family)